MAYFDRLLNQKDLSVCDELLAPGYNDSDAPADTPPDQVIAETKAYVANMLAQYPDMSIQIEDVIAEGNKVVLRNTWRGTHRETREKFDRMGIVILEFDEAGKITRRWSAYKKS